MVGAKKFICLLIISILAIVSVNAFDVKIKPVKNKISIDDLAVFEVTITNTLKMVTESYRVKTLDYPIWDVYTLPIMNPLVVEVPPNTSKTLTLYVDPLHVFSIGTVDVNVKITAEKTKQEKIIPLRVSVVSTEPLVKGYVPTVIARVNIPSEIDPRKEIPIKIRLDNQNILNYSNLRIKVESNLINEERVVSLEPLEKKVITITTRVDPLLPPQKDTLVVTGISENRTIITPITIPIRIKSYSELEREVTPIKGFLKRGKLIKFTNNGNIKYEGEVKIKTSFLKELFTSTSPKGKFVRKGKEKYLIWVVSLAPKESITVRVVENYLLLVIIIILIATILIIYYLRRSPIVLIKKATNIVVKEGGISEMKILLTIKNRGKEAVKNIKVIELIPKIVNIEKELTIGTIPPTKIKHDKKGSILKWVIEEIDPKEERIINYKIKSILPILGELKLPAAIAKFNFKGREITSYSNTVNIIV